MSVSLFKHNQAAYDAAVSMLRETGKAAIIHPTGTGKSFIGFRFCADYPDAVICWLSPSEYIFKTQVENLKRASGDFVPRNIRFFTYAKLARISVEEIKEIKPDYIILDEFHRCGAEMWGQGVQTLLRAYPDAPILGLSATNIRYLDNQRDMADELFDGNIASQMTLGEAIVRGILNPPVYVTALYSYQKDLEKYERRVKSARTKAVRDAGEQYLEALRRALEKADGLDEIFRKHMTDKNGKYIVFCANAEHMREMIGKAAEHFGKVDAEAHIYSAYSSDPETSRAFQEFKADGSDHLKLLFCIDMLNEGVHVDDVSGVILFRPTVSPIIYKQQIGRALSASGKKNAVIFDIVNNIENLYSIGAIEQEMQAAINYYRFFGKDQEIVNEHFRVIDDVREAKALFDQLNDTLTASWDLMYAHAKRYFEEFGNLEVPKRYKTEDGYGLGTWLMTQRKVYNGEQYGLLSRERIEKLEAIGMFWGSHRDLSWDRHFAEAERYRERFGDLNISAQYVTQSGVKLGAWISNLRTYRKSGIQSAYLTMGRIRALDSLGMIWDVPDYLWEENFSACMAYYREHGNLDIPLAYTAPNGLRIGTWIRKLRQIYHGSKVGAALTPEQVERLNSIGMLWDNKYTRAWEAGLSEARSYYEQNGNLNVSATYITPDGFKLGDWLSNRREAAGEGKLSQERRRQLDELGMVWEKPDPWEVRYTLAKAYFEEHGDLNIPPQYKADGIWLAKWLNEQRQIYIGNRPGKALTSEQITRLEAIGMTWEKQSDALWNRQYEAARAFYEQNGHLNVPVEYRTADGRQLSVWMIRQRKARKNGKLTGEQIAKLDAIGMVWAFEDPWENGFSHAEQYFREHGDLNVPARYVCEDGFKLHVWLTNQRSNHNHPTQYHRLTEEQTMRLEALGIAWSVQESRWSQGYEHAKDYLLSLEGEKWSFGYISSDGFKTGEWLRSQSRLYQAGKISPARQSMLHAIGFAPGSQYGQL